MPRRAARPTFIVTCEHGGNRVPHRHQRLFTAHRSLLNSHRGHDLGALELAHRFGRALGTEAFTSTTTRLLVDLNRSLGHPALFSPMVRSLDESERTRLVHQFYRPFRHAVLSAIRAATQAGRRVIHLSVHSFTPVLDGVPRRADIGILYDPRRDGERAWCVEWQRRLHDADSSLRIRRNYPYRGTADGHTSDLRRHFSEREYLGIELEVNQRFPKTGGRRWRELQYTLIESFQEAHFALQR